MRWPTARVPDRQFAFLSSDETRLVRAHARLRGGCLAKSSLQQHLLSKAGFSCHLETGGTGYSIGFPLQRSSRALQAGSQVWSSLYKRQS